MGAKNNFYSDFSEYFEHICSQLKPLKDNMAHGKECYFYNYDKDFLQGLRSRASFPCVIREGVGWRETTVKYTDYNGYIYKTRSTSFVVADSYDRADDQAQIDESLSNCERIGEEIVKRMYEDSGKYPCIDGFNMQEVANTVELNTEQRIVMVQFRIDVMSVVDECIDNNMWEE